jgi:hypothetical protein
MVEMVTSLGILIMLFIVFLYIDKITNMLGHNLDILPIRMLAVILVLGAVSYNKMVALGVFLVICAIYIKHHHNDIKQFTGLSNNMGSYNQDESKYNHVMSKLDHGGLSDESVDTMEFTSKSEDQDNEFKTSESSIDEKHVLNTEALGSRSQSLFPDDSKHANVLEHGNKNGYYD